MASTPLRSVWNAIVYFFTRKHTLEGRFDVRKWLYHNWDRSYVVRPSSFLRPTTEATIRAAVLGAQRVSAVGAGHSFNDLHLGSHVLISLDMYAGLTEHDAVTNTATFRAGTRLRDVTRILHGLGLALPVLPDHNAQSLGGILATDVHASGKSAHVSQAITRLRLLDGLGNFHNLHPDDPLFRATVGGMGCTGIVLEVTLGCQPSFRLETTSFRCSWEHMLKNLENWSKQYDRLAAGYFPAFDACIVETKTVTSKPLTAYGPWIESVSNVLQAILQASMLPLSRRPNGFLRRFGCRVLAAATRRRRPALVLESAEGFNRNVYQIHKEAEFTVPLSQARKVLEEGHALMLANPQQAYYVLGVRLSKGNPHTLIGPAAQQEQNENDIAWIAPHLDGNVVDPRHDAEWGALCRKYRGRPHYGKNMLGMGGDYLADVHGQRWQEFLSVVARHDPLKKFANALIRTTSNGQSANRDAPVAALVCPPGRDPEAQDARL